jgi:hypothetical protein
MRMLLTTFELRPVFVLLLLLQWFTVRVQSVCNTQLPRG